MRKLRLTNCQNLAFSTKVAQTRLEKAMSVFGEAVVKKIIGLALYWLGAKRNMIADLLDMPLESLRTSVRVIQRDGLSALEDRRRKHSDFLPEQEKTDEPGVVMVSNTEDELVFDFSEFSSSFGIPVVNKLQLRAVILTLSAAGGLSTETAAEILGLSKSHTAGLVKSLICGDAAVLADRREGQKTDYRVDDRAKGELLVQWALNAAAGRSTSSEQISKDLQQRCGIVIPDRTLRTHVGRFGLTKLGRKLTGLIKDVKKGF